MTAHRSDHDDLRAEIADLQAQLHATDMARLHAQAILDDTARAAHGLVHDLHAAMGASAHTRGIGPDPYPHGVPQHMRAPDDVLATADLRERVAQLARHVAASARTSQARTNARLICDALGIDRPTAEADDE